MNHPEGFEFSLFFLAHWGKQVVPLIELIHWHKEFMGKERRERGLPFRTSCSPRPRIQSSFHPSRKVGLFSRISPSANLLIDYAEGGAIPLKIRVMIPPEEQGIVRINEIWWVMIKESPLRGAKIYGKRRRRRKEYCSKTEAKFPDF